MAIRFKNQINNSIRLRRVRVSFFLFSSLIINFYPGFSQNPSSSKIEAVARFRNDSILLRYSPANAQAWLYGNQYGYTIKRYTLKKGNDFSLTDPEVIQLTESPIKPQPLSALETLAEKDKYVAILAQAIYGERFQTGTANGAVQLVNKAKELENRFSFALFSADQSVEAAKAGGLFFVDKKVKKGESYLYRVYINLPANVVHKVDTGFVYIDTSQPVELPKLVDVKAVFKNHLVQLSWDKEYAESFFCRYSIERAEGKGEFIPLDLPTIIQLTESRASSKRITVTDSLPSNDTPYRYRVKGVTIFGEISEPSQEVSGKGVEEKKVDAPMITTHRLLDKGQIEFSWQYPTELEDPIQGFEISRSNKAKGNFQVIGTKLKPDQRSYIDHKPNPTNYYVVSAIDKYGKKQGSFPALIQLLDSIPPKAPIELKGLMDSTGVVKLTWKNNTEPDLKMYRVFKANQPQAPFLEITHEELKENRFTDTVAVRWINKGVYYKVVAVDYHYNQSPYSKMLEVKRPDLIAPSAPVLSKIEASTTTIYLEWKPSSSEDVASYQIYRKGRTDKDWKLVKQTNQKDKVYQYIDPVEKGKEYTYALIAQDSAGLQSSFDNTIKVKSIDDKTIPKVTSLKATVDRVNKKIVLSWSYPTPIEKVKIYKAEKGKPLSIWKVLEGIENQTEDNEIYINTSYEYAIQVIAHLGAESPLSERVGVKY